jgi:2-polyprenyl-6-methoxyphenol hydroxylase-like FAD-dependent oxidoreductase
MYDVVIIGAGVIGLSIARSLGEKTSLSVLVVEKDDSFGRVYQVETVKLFTLEFIMSQIL